MLKETFNVEQFDYFNSPEQEIIDQEESLQINKIIRCCIEELPPKQQEIIYLRFEHELSYEDISYILEITVESCHKTVYRSIKSIRLNVEKLLGKRIM